MLRSTIAACFRLSEIISQVILVLCDNVDGALMRDFLLLMPAVVVWAALSRMVHQLLAGKGLRAAVMVFAVAAGAFLLVKELI